SRVVIWVELYREGVEQPIARVILRNHIVYDIWDEKFRVGVNDGAGTRETQWKTEQEAIAQATELRRLPVTDLGRLGPGVSYRVRFRADLNPVSDELAQDARRWLVRPPGQGRSGGGDSFFGSFVSIFVNPRIEESERQVIFTSQPFAKPGPGEV